MSLSLTETAILFGAQLNGSGTYKAICPCHEDSKPSLEIKAANNGGVVMICRAGCSTESILATKNKRLSDLMPPREDKPKRTIEKVYIYEDENRQPLFRKVRYVPKSFALQRSSGGDKWDWGLSGVRRVLYHLPELIAADPEQFVYIVEGEKDVDRAAKMGFLATCNFDGAGKWSSDYAEHFRGRHVVIIADNDESGRAHARMVAQSLHSVAASVRILELPGLPDKGDLSDWADAGGTDEQLGELTEACPLWDPASEPAEATEPPAEVEPEEKRIDLPAPVSLSSLITAHPKMREPIIHGLARRGEVVNLIAAPKFGKSWLTYLIALCIVCGLRLFGKFACYPGPVLILDNELHPETFSSRVPLVAKELGIDLQAGDVGEQIQVVNLRGKLADLPAIGRYMQQFEPRQFQVVIIDAFYRTLPADTDENSNAQITALYNLLDSIAAHLECAILLVHHASKGNQSLKAITDVGSGAGSQSRAADTHLILRPHKEDGAAVLEAAVRSWPPVEPMCVRWKFPTWQADEGLDPAELRAEKQRGTQSVARNAEKVLKALADGPKTSSGIRTRTGRNATAIADALELLIEQGQVESTVIEMKNGTFEGFQISTRTNPD